VFRGMVAEGLDEALPILTSALYAPRNVCTCGACG
jgi:hypothetical protein